MKVYRWVVAAGLVSLFLCGAFSAAAEGTVAVEPDKAVSGLKVTEKGVSWTQLDMLNIFNNPALGGEKIVSPGQSGSYAFTIENHTGYTLDYSVVLSEVNRWSIPMLCRLRSEEAYIGGPEWRTPDTITVPAGQLSVDGARFYTLEWRWASASDEEDTLLGIGEDVSYTIRLDITAAQDGPAPDTGDTEPYRWVWLTAGASGTLLLLSLLRRRGHYRARHCRK